VVKGGTFCISVAVEHGRVLAIAKVVVFVGKHGSAKSVVAAADFNRLAAENKPATEGLDVSGWKATSLRSLGIERSM
jgi:hypothetical protein